MAVEDSDFSDRELRHRDESFDVEDERWSLRNQLMDWVILLGLIAIHLTWMWLVWFFEPGLR